ncbi:MAG: nitroreductase family protein [Planctomycetota bacterium]
MDFTEVIMTRRSVRSFKPDPIPDDVLIRVLNVGRFAPSANNLQPWRFIVVRDEVRRRKLAEHADQPFVGEAPIVLVCCGKRYHDRYSWISDRLYLMDCAIAIDHLTLAARNEGLGTCWIGAFQRGRVMSVAQVPAEYDALMLLPIGYPASEKAFHETSARQPLSDIVSELPAMSAEKK